MSYKITDHPKKYGESTSKSSGIYNLVLVGGGWLASCCGHCVTRERTLLPIRLEAAWAAKQLKVAKKREVAVAAGDRILSFIQ
jgi:hypothetical protein